MGGGLLSWEGDNLSFHRAKLEPGNFIPWLQCGGLFGCLTGGRRRSGPIVEVSQWKPQRLVFCLFAKPVVEIEKELFFNVLIDFNLHRPDLDIDGFAVALHHESHLFSGGL